MFTSTYYLEHRADDTLIKAANFHELGPHLFPTHISGQAEPHQLKSNLPAKRWKNVDIVMRDEEMRDDVLSRFHDCRSLVDNN